MLNTFSTPGTLTLISLYWQDVNYEQSYLLVGFIIYAIAMIWLGWFVSRNQKSGEDFLLGGRSLPLFLTLGSTVATMVGTGSSMGQWALATAMAGPECFMASVEP